MGGQGHTRREGAGGIVVAMKREGENMTIFEMLKDLQENHRDDESDSWILLWSPHWKLWLCSLVGWDQTIPGWDKTGPRKSFRDATPEGCVQQAWESEKSRVEAAG